MQVVSRAPHKLSEALQLPYSSISWLVQHAEIVLSVSNTTATDVTANASDHECICVQQVHVLRKYY
jgi:hypothetical protein